MILKRLLSLKDRTDVLKKWIEDPAREAREYVREVIMGYVTGVAIVAVIVLGGLALLGFGEVLGGPHQAARVLFYVGCVALGLVCIALWFIWRKIYAYAQRLEDMYRERTARKVEYREERDTIYLNDDGTERDN